MVSRKNHPSQTGLVADAQCEQSNSDPRCTQGIFNGEAPAQPACGPPSRFAGDVILFYEFQDPKLTGDDLHAHPVMRKIEKCAADVAHKNLKPELRKQLENEGFIRLRTQGQYSGRNSLDAYIYTVLNNLTPKLIAPLVPGKLKFVKQDDETPEGVSSCSWKYDCLDDQAGNAALELLDLSTWNLPEKVLAKLATEQCMKELMTRSDVRRAIGEIIKDFIQGRDEDEDDPAGKLMNDRRMKTKVSKKLGRPVTRYRTHQALEQFKPVFAELLLPAFSKAPDRSTFRA